MTTTPARRLAAGATTVLLAAGLLTPAALAVADELPVEGQTTTVLDPAAAADPASDTAEPPASASATEPLDPGDAASTEPAAAAPVEAAPAPEAPATTTALAPGPLAAQTLTLAANESRTLQFAVADATTFQAFALGQQIELSMALPAGSSITSRPDAGVIRHTQVAGSPLTGTLTVTVANLADTAQLVPLTVGAWGPAVQPRVSTSLKQSYLSVVANPFVNGASRTDLTGQLTVIGTDGVARSIALRPQTTGSTAYYGRFDDLAPGDYVVEVRVRVDGTDHVWAGTIGVFAPDTTPPVVAYTTEPAASNAHGWFRRAVRATLAASDTGTGVWMLRWAVGTDPYTEVRGDTATVDFTTEGVHSLRSSAVDYQQNASTESTRTIRIDLTDPVVVIGGLTEDQQIEEGAEVIVDYSCDDALSGVLSCDGPAASGEALDTTTPGSYSYEVVATDRAGNLTRLSRSYTVLAVDTVAPQLDVDLPAPPATGWHTRAVTLRFSASDEESGIALIHWEYGTGSGVVVGSSTEPDAELELADTGSYTVEVWAEDAAGNRSTTQRHQVRVDVDAPRIELTSPEEPASILPNGHYAQHERVTVDFTCSDRGSGLASCDATTPAGEYLPTGAPGAHELRIVATDEAGNRTERVVRYTVDAAPGSSPAASRDPRLAQTGAETVLAGVLLVAALLAAGVTLLVSRRLGGR